MTTKLRSGKVIDPSMDELSGLFSKSMKFSTPKSKKRVQPTEDDMFANMFNKITISKKIGKSRRKGSRLTHKKTHRKTPNMDLTGGRRRRRRRRSSNRRH